MIRIHPEKCVGCNACIRACPINDANLAEMIHGNLVISVNEKNCIHCGECTKVCTHHARYFEDDTRQFFQDLNTRRIAVLVTPAIKVAFRDTWPAVLRWLQSQRNVAGVYDVSFGADICTYMHLKAIKEKKVGKIISQPCAALTDYILKYKHHLIPYLSPIHSPILCAAIYFRKYCRITEPLAVLSPCIAKKTEFVDTGVVSYNVVFSQLKRYMEESKVSLPSVQSFEFDGVPALSGAIYPMPGGLKECLLAMDPSLKVISSEGIPAVYQNLEDYDKLKDSVRPDVFDVLSCEYGCVSGPGVSHDISYFEMMDTMSRVKQDAFAKQNKQLKKGFRKGSAQYKRFDAQLNMEDFIRTYQPKKLNLPHISSFQIDEAFRSLHKHDKAEQTIDCRACGYMTCKHMALAVARGMNFPSNCHQYTLKNMELEEQNTRERVARTHEIQDKVNLLSGELTGEVRAMSDYSNHIISTTTDHLAAIDTLQNAIQEFQKLGTVMLNDISAISEINEQYVANSLLVKDIAQQIKLVSVNASIEAARAGSAGNGFAFVAKEVGSLADKTQFATDNFADSSQAVSQKTATMHSSVENICTMISSLSSTLTELKTVFESTGKMGSDIYQLSGQVHALSAQIQKIINEP